jgi:hypothetical protein
MITLQEKCEQSLRHAFHADVTPALKMYRAVCLVVVFTYSINVLLYVVISAVFLRMDVWFVSTLSHYEYIHLFTLSVQVSATQVHLFVVSLCTREQ